jgi:hypothetical protein
MKKILYLIAVSTILFTACKKQALVENTVYEKVNPGDPKYSYIKILNLTPGSPVLTYYMDGTKFSGGLSSLGVENAGYTYNQIYPDLGYSITAPGTHTLTAKVIPTATADAGLEVFNTSISPAAGKYYTIFTTGLYTATNKKIASSVMLEDIKPALDTSKIFVRIANLYNGGPNIDLVKGDVVTTGVKVISNVAYGTASEWVAVPAPGNGTAPTFKVFFNDAATGIPLIAAGVTISLSKGRAYTLYLRGIAGNATYPFSGTFYTTFY